MNLAPNGKPSNLTPEQYKLVRTPEFKAWFGDWENNPEGASKVIDENGGNVPDEFWGNQAGGVLIICSRTNKVLLLKRSPYVQEPETWGMISGKIDAGETVEEAVAREVKEETGWKIDNLIPSYVFKKNDFTFYNFISVVDIEFTPTLDWENTDYGWFDLDNLPENLHFGVEILLLKENIKDFRALENKKAEYFREGGYVKSKKVYVSIKLPYDINKVSDTFNKYFYDFKNKPFQELKDRQLNGLVGVSKSSWNIADWFIHRDCLIVMNYYDFKELNDVTEIEYDNPEQLMANDLELFNRLYNNKRDSIKMTERDFQSQRESNLSTIFKSFHFPLEVAIRKEKSSAIKNELTRIQYFLNPLNTSVFLRWIINNNIIINSPKELADAIYNYHASDDSKKEVSAYYVDDILINPDYLLPIVNESLIKAGNIYHDEQEIILNDKTLRIPENSQLFFKIDGGFDTKSNLLDKINEFNLDSIYRVHYVSQSDLDKYRKKIDDKRLELSKTKLKEGKEKLEQRKESVLPTLLDEIKKHISEYYYSQAKKLNDSRYYKDYEGDDTKFYSVEEIPEVQILLNGALKTAELLFNEIFSDKKVQLIDKFTFSDFTYRLNDAIRDYLNDVQDLDLIETIYSYHDEYNNYVNANDLSWSLRELFDYDEPVKSLTKDGIKERYIELMEGEMFRYYSNNDLNLFKKGGKTIAQTPAPKKDRIKGSAKNKEGSSKDIKSAKSIKLSDKTLKSIKNKIDEHNSKYPKKKINLASAKAVVRRGMGAYSSSHRPTIKGGKPNSRVAWGLARLNAFIYKIVNGKSKSGKYSQDNDLIKELGYKVQKYSEGGSAETNNNEEMKNVSVSINMYWGEIDSIYDGIKIESPEDNVHFMEWADENNFDYEQWGESELIDTSWGYEYIVPFNDYKNYIINSRNKRYGGGELKKGIKTEMEHKETIEKIKSGNYSTKESAELIAKDHLKENDKYYTNLAEMESKFDDGGSTYAGVVGVVDCIEYIKNSEPIKNNGYYLHFDNLNNYVGANSVNIPKINSLCIITFNSGDSNMLALEISKLLNIDIEIARIIVYEQTTYSKPFTMDVLKDIENKNIIVADSDKIVCDNLSNNYNEGGQTPAQQEKIAKVMGEFKRGELNTSYGTKVTDDKQAIAIALSGAGVEKKNDGGLLNKMQDEKNIIFGESIPEHAKIYGFESKKPLYIQHLCVPTEKRNNGEGSKIIQELEDFARENQYDYLFGHISTKAKYGKEDVCDVQKIRKWLEKRGYKTSEKTNDFYKQIFEQGGVIQGQLHTECNDESGCGEKFDVGGVGNVIEAERDEAVIVSNAFKDTNKYTIKGTPSQIASALNVMGGGKNFDSGAVIYMSNGKQINTDNIKQETNDTDVKDDIEAGSIIINRRSMYDDTVYEVSGTPKQIASAINSVNGFGKVIEDGATIKEA